MLNCYMVAPLETRKLSPVRKSASFGDVEQVQVIEEIEESEVLSYILSKRASRTPFILVCKAGLHEILFDLVKSHILPPPWTQHA